MSRLGKYTRRTLLVGAVAVAGGVAFGVYKYRQPLPNPFEADGMLDDDEYALNPFLIINQDGVTIVTGQSEMGQGVHSAMALMVAEELDLPWESVRVINGPASNAYYNKVLLEGIAGTHQYDHSEGARKKRGYTHIPAKFMGIQITGGSTSTPYGYDTMRKAGAAARLALIEAAAAQWDVDPQSLSTADGYVINAANDERLSYTELASAAAQVDVPSDPPLRPRSEWKLIGKSKPRVDIPAKVNGVAEFAVDVQQPNLLHATVRMSPRFGKGIERIDSTKAEAMPGVQRIVNLGTGIGVIADNTWRAFNAAAAVDITWQEQDAPRSTADIFNVLEAGFDGEVHSEFENIGDVETELDNAENIVEAEYRVPFLAHTTMEPMAATAQIKDGVIDIWTGSQAQTMVRDTIAKLSGFSKNNVNVHTTYLGGGFGRRSEMDFCVLAYKLAAEVEGYPVKVIWTREEDTRHDFYRPAAIARMRGVMGERTPHAIDARVSTPSILASMAARGGPPAMGPDVTTIEGLHGQPEKIEHLRITAYTPEQPVPIGFWRSVGASINAFFHESFMDELASQAGIDPIAMRLDMMDDLTPTGRSVVEKVAEMANWQGGKVGVGKGRGFAFCQSFNCHSAQIIDVSVDGDAIRIDDIYAVVDVGVAIDPRNVEAQVQSAIIYGLTAAKNGEVTFNAEGEVEQSNFHDYTALRMNETPRIHTAVLENNPSITGVGEPGTPPVFPALGNAIFAATGKRIRTLPFAKQVQFTS